MPGTRCPLRAVNDRIGIATQYVAMGYEPTCLQMQAEFRLRSTQWHSESRRAATP